MIESCFSARPQAKEAQERDLLERDRLRTRLQEKQERADSIAWQRQQLGEAMVSKKAGGER